MNKVLILIPSRLSAQRLPGKPLLKINNLPIISHVVKRGQETGLGDVIVCAEDSEIVSAVEKNGGKAILTGNHHKNGTSRVSEAIEKIDCTHVILLQGDEPLLLPEHVNNLMTAISRNPSGSAWNATGEINNNSELKRHSFVKCMIGVENKILACFRKSPCFSSIKKQKLFIRKILGIIAYNKEFLLKIKSQSFG